MADDINKELKKLQDQLKNSAKMQGELSSGMSAYLGKVKELGELKESIVHAEEQIAQYTEETKQKQQELNAEVNKGLKADKVKIQNLKNELALRGKVGDELKENLNTLEEQSQEMAKQVVSVNKQALAFNSIRKGVKAIPGLLKQGYGTLQKTGIFELDKSIRDAGKSLNVTKKQYEGFSDDLVKAARTTNNWGVSAKDLAKTQQSYSEEIGRSVLLTKEGHIAMSEMAKGTGLGIEGASAMASEMDKFGLSVTASRDVVSDTVKMAAKMGVNSTKAVKTLQNSLRLSQRFHFRGGVKGIAKMANEAARMKLDMEGIAGLAEKVFRPEGAVEMAAQLQVMGGAFARMANPMELMFKARNDFEGFAKDIGKATAEFVSFNKQTGEYQIKGGLAADRMREIANITGIGVEKLQEMAVEQAKLNKIGGSLFKIKKEDRALVSSLAQWNKNKNTYEVKFAGKDPINIKDLTQAKLDIYKKEQETLEERAKQGETFDDTMKNFVNQLKEGLLPIAVSLKDGLGKDLIKFAERLEKEGFYQKMTDFAKNAGSFIKGVTDIVASIVNTLGPTGTLIGGIGLAIGGKMVEWFLRGRQLAKGFNSLVGGGTGGGLFESLAGGKGKGKGKRGFGRKAMGKMFGKRGLKASSAMGKFGKSLGGVGGGLGRLGGGLGIGALGIGADIGRGMLGNEQSGLGKGLGVLGSAAEYAAYGSMLGPWGTLIGALVGGGKGYYDEYLKKQHYEPVNSSFKKIDDGVIKFNGNDKFMKVDDSTMIAGTNVNGNKDLAKAMSGGGSSKMEHKFDDININIKLESSSEWLNTIGDEITSNRTFVRDLTTKIHEEIRMAIGGGKLNPNPL